MSLLPRKALACGLPHSQTTVAVGKRIKTQRPRRHPPGLQCTVSNSVSDSVSDKKPPQNNAKRQLKLPQKQSPPDFRTYNKYSALQNISSEPSASDNTDVHPQPPQPTRKQRRQQREERRFKEHLNNALQAPPDDSPRHQTISSPLPRIPVCINGKPTHALLDTGSTHNFITSALAQKWTPSELQTVSLAAEGAKMDVLGTCSLHVTIQKSHSRTTFHVTENLSHPVILGYPWLRDQAVHIDFSRHSAHLGTKNRTTVHWQPSPPNPTPKTPETPTNGFPPHLQHEFTEMITRFPEILSSTTQTTTTKTVTHKIHVTTNTPFNIRPYPYPPQKSKQSCNKSPTC